MNLAIVSPMGIVPGEQESVVSLLENGLHIYHLRKPGLTSKELHAWLDKLPQQYRSRITVHGPITIAMDLMVGGVHFRESDRAGLSEGELDDMLERAEMEDMRISASLHNPAATATISSRFLYVFLSQAFDSNSKPYPGTLDKWDLPANRATKVYALGGVTAERIPQVAAKGLDGVAVLSAVWQGKADPLSNYLELRAACEKVVPAS